MTAPMTSTARAHWLRIKERFEAGDPKIPNAARRMAEEVLGETFVRRGKGNRPDRADRQAGDRSFDRGEDDGMVVL